MLCETQSTQKIYVDYDLEKFMFTGTWKKSYVINYVNWEQGLYFYVP